MTIKGTVHPRIPKHTYLLSAVYPFRSLGCELSNIGDISCRDVALLSDMMELGGSCARSAKKISFKNSTLDERFVLVSAQDVNINGV